MILDNKKRREEIGYLTEGERKKAYLDWYDEEIRRLQAKERRMKRGER